MFRLLSLAACLQSHFTFYFQVSMKLKKLIKSFLETQDKPTVDVIEEIRYRTQSVTSGHPFRSVPPSLTEETQSLVRTDSDDRLSYHRYMSIAG